MTGDFFRTDSPDTPGVRHLAKMRDDAARGSPEPLSNLERRRVAAEKLGLNAKRDAAFHSGLGLLSLVPPGE
jgi:hypothetical protein